MNLRVFELEVDLSCLDTRTRKTVLAKLWGRARGTWHRDYGPECPLLYRWKCGNDAALLALCLPRA